MKTFNCPSVFLFDTRFSNTDKLFAMLIMASDSEIFDFECAKILGVTDSEITKSLQRLKKFGAATQEGEKVTIDISSLY